MKKINMLVLVCTILTLSFIGCKKESLSTASTQPQETGKRNSSGGGTAAPAVSFIYPTNGATVTGTITVQIAASSAIGIKNTSLMQTVGTFNCLFGNDNTSPYEYVWNTNSLCTGAIAPGAQVKLRATATDNNGVISYTDIYVTKQ
ncbi:MAG: Ig-like domain-containing protein [Sphingobacteriales bacterium]|nr:Ig-like domain-containing protein [Sphingobacteriales bacterium]